VPNLTGGYSAMLPNHHITKPVLIGEIQDDGQFEVVWETSGLVPGDAWSDFLPESKPLISDWRAPDVLRQLQHRDRQVRRLLMVAKATAACSSSADRTRRSNCSIP
jgi:hypothetical protein